MGSVRSGRVPVIRGAAAPFEPVVPSARSPNPFVYPKALLPVLLAAMTVAPAASQVRFGVVWNPPADRLEAEADLTAMRAMGFSAVRTGIVEDGSLLSIADSLGISVYQELSLDVATASEVSAAVPRLREELSRALATSDGHPSATWFGLAYAPATYREDACRALRQLVDYARPRAAPGTRFYYVSWFPGRDRCSDVVDLVLLDDAAHDRPTALLAAWRDSGPVGLAAVGRWIDPGASPGVRNLHSEERQALFLADVLPQLRASRAEVVFLYRWQDPVDEGAFHPAPLRRVHGLHDETGRARPARDVAARALTVGQTAFALSEGQGADDRNSVFVLFGLLVFLGIAVMLGVSPRFRAMAPRYFVAHGFYRSAVQDGREAPGYVASVLAVLLGVVIGLLSWMVFLSAMDGLAVHGLWYRSGPGARGAMDALAANPVLFAVLAGSVGLFALVFWLSAWSFAASRRSKLRAPQALLLATWPRWPMLILLLAAMLIVAAGLDGRTREIEWIVMAWYGSAAWGTVRGSLDLARVSRVNALVMVLYWLLSPVVLLTVLALAVQALDPEAAGLYRELLGR